MASVTSSYMTRYHHKHRKAGKKRKKQIARKGSTPTRAAFFGDSDKK